MTRLIALAVVALVVAGGSAWAADVNYSWVVVGDGYAPQVEMHGTTMAADAPATGAAPDGCCGGCPHTVAMGHPGPIPRYEDGYAG